MTVKVTHIHCTACPPVKRAGDFNRLKIEAVLPSSICESKPKPNKKAGNKAQTTIGFLRSEQNWSVMFDVRYVFSDSLLCITIRCYTHETYVD